MNIEIRLACGYGCSQYGKAAAGVPPLFVTNEGL
jgi:hypothetical protein